MPPLEVAEGNFFYARPPVLTDIPEKLTLPLPKLFLGRSASLFRL